MTTQESFKRRIRSRMAKTGERYNAARRVLLAQRGGGATAAGGWVASPGASNELILAKTGHAG